MWKRADEILQQGSFFIYFLIFYVFLLLKRYFFIQQSTSTFFNVIKVCFPGFKNMGIRIMQSRIAVGVHTFCKALFLRAKLVFGCYSFYPVFSFVLYFAFQMFVGFCTSILKTFKKSFKNVSIYFNHVGFCYFLTVFTC